MRIPGICWKSWSLNYYHQPGYSSKS